MATIIILVIILACVIQQVFFGSIVRSFAILISAILGAFIALNFFEMLAQQLIGSDIMAWTAHGVSLGLLFVLSFGLLVAASMKLLIGEIAFSKLIDKVGGAVIGVFTGLIISGIIVITLGMASSSSTFPYERFPISSPDVKKPGSAYVDGFVAGFFGLVSNGSLAGENSFEAIHASFNDAIAFDRLSAEKRISPLAGKSAIQPPAVIRLAPETITDVDGKKLPENPGNDLVLMRLNFTKSVVGKDSPNFMLGQLRLICRNKDSKGLPGEGSGTGVYPVGYMKTTGLLMESLSAQMPLAEVQMDGSSKPADIAFYIPAGMKPSLIEFKRNFVIPAPPLTDPKDAPEPVGFEKAAAQKAADPNSVGTTAPAKSKGKKKTPKPAPVADANSN
jgi:hypothetical protein